jgi:hypothetical protein
MTLRKGICAICKGEKFLWEVIREFDDGKENKDYICLDCILKKKNFAQLIYPSNHIVKVTFIR